MATVKEVKGINIKQAFELFDKANPEVYNLFEMKALTAYQMGKNKMSSKLIINVIRWEAFIQTEDKFSTFKINDAYTSHYARKFALNNPSLKNLFNYRELRDTDNN